MSEAVRIEYVERALCGRKLNLRLREQKGEIVELIIERESRLVANNREGQLLSTAAPERITHVLCSGESTPRRLKTERSNAYQVKVTLLH
jgi:hypothetical protein